MFLRRKKQPQDYAQDYFTDRPYLTGLLTGLAAGLTVGFLFAPKSGKDLRKQITGTLDDQVKGAHNQWDKTKAQAKETINTIKTNIGLAANKVEDELDSYVDRAMKNADKAEKEGEKAVQETDRLAKEAKSAID